MSGEILFQRWDEGRIDARHPIEVHSHEGTQRTPEEALAELARFRGEMLSKSYAIERQLDALVVWQLFGTRTDEGVAFFEQHILDSSAFGLQLKTKLASLILRDWDFLEDVDVREAARQLSDSKSRRDRVAHWPVVLLPVRLPDGRVVDFVPLMSKGKESYRLTPDEQATWLREADAAETALRVVSRAIFQHARDWPES